MCVCGMWVGVGGGGCGLIDLVGVGVGWICDVVCVRLEWKLCDLEVY